MTNGPATPAKVGATNIEDEPHIATEMAPIDILRQAVAREIAIETKRLWQEAQLAGLDNLALLMEEAFYLAYKEAGGPKVMRAV